ncbi:MAG: SDR family oxidoreductase [Actinomycetia bacterium]|nr:SDR family oxidoreductase [Actinomycetes bacterium]MCP3911682.1 SDR family oxidoreductase [Actinomycetes bacterium]MCP4086951.1 SDR family oxidoreductase [Actinomycetes bacterium]
MDLGLTDRTVLITGSHRGTGAGIARVFAGEGAQVLVHGFETDQGTDVVDDITDRGGRARLVTGNLMTDEGAAAVVDAAGPVDVLVNNYGLAGRGTWETDSDEWFDAWNRNVVSGVRMVHGCVPSMREQGWGRVIFVGTVGSARPGDRMPHYYSSKAALPGLVVSLARDLGGSGITANLVSPGLIATAEVRQRFMRMGAQKGWGSTWEEVAPRALEGFMPSPATTIPDPEDVGRVVAFVAGHTGWPINGANIRVDGGAAMTPN